MSALEVREVRFPPVGAFEHKCVHKYDDRGRRQDTAHLILGFWGGRRGQAAAPFRDDPEYLRQVFQAAAQEGWQYVEIFDCGYGEPVPAPAPEAVARVREMAQAMGLQFRRIELSWEEVS